ncbi:MAG: hypothetical protein ACFFCO_07480, partial [Promethearchaeota archaeon]
YSVARVRVEGIFRKLGGLHSAEEVMRRLESYCPFRALALSPGHQQRLESMEQFFEVLGFMKEGGTFMDAERRFGIDNGTVGRWFRGKCVPFLVHLAMRIPEENPGSGCMWLPVKLKPGRGFRPDEFIRVPITIDNWRQVKEVLSQISALKNKDMRKWIQRFGETSQEEALAYLLGMMISDGGKPKLSCTSTGLDVTFSKGYEWSERVGEAVCYYLGLLGIRAGRYVSPYVKEKSLNMWVSEKSPLITWMMQTCLGLRPGDVTTYNPVRADWILKAPNNIRLRFLHGLSDGDGHAKVGSQLVGITCIANRDYVQKLLHSFDIGSCFDRGSVNIIRVGCVQRAVGLPFFLHAVGRQEKAEKIGEMLRVRSDQKQRRRIPCGVLRRIVELRNEGRSYGEISEVIFNEYNRSYSRSTILKIIRRTKAAEGS